MNGGEQGPSASRLTERYPGPVLRLDLDGIVRDGNLAAQELFGADRLVGNRWVDCCPGLTDGGWEAILAGDSPIVYDADIGPTCVQFTHVVSHEEHAVFVFGADISEHRFLGRQLAEYASSRSDIARFYDMDPGPVLRLDRNGTVLLANSPARRLFGEEAISARWLDICPGLSRELWARILATEEPVQIEVQVSDNVLVFTHRYESRSGLVFVFGTDITRQKLAERTLLQTEKMATLGTLAAGIAHELNNPAAAARRAAEQLREAIGKLESTLIALDTRALTEPGMQEWARIDAEARARAQRPEDLDALTRSDREALVEDWLDDQGIAEGWSLAPSLVALGKTPDDLGARKGIFGSQTLPAILDWAAGTYPVYRLLYEISQASGRISEIVAAMKGYSYLGQAPLQTVDIHEGLDNTLVILRSKLKSGIHVRREYDPTLPAITAFGSELNQVWTNLLDNAADAMGGMGVIAIRTRVDGGDVVVEIEDDGPGIPDDVQKRIFDPFFSTKEPGKGTGLGLSTTYSIVTDKHRGRIEVASRPGSTVFTVRLPIRSPHFTAGAVGGEEDGLANQREGT